MRGVGIGLRRPLYDAILKTTRRVDWLEIVPENFLGVGGRPAAVLEACAARFAIASHGVALSVGGPDPLDEEYLSRLRELLDQLELPSFTDHLCYASAGGVHLHDLLPLPFTEESAHWCAARAREASERLERPLSLENITYYATMPGSVMSEGEFVRAVLDESSCGLLLDINNVYVNAINHGRSPLAALLELPLERTTQIHLAGHVREEGLLIDNHGAPVADEVWDLFREALTRVGPVPVLLEWDTEIPTLDRILDEADRARAIVDEVTGAASARRGAAE